LYNADLLMVASARSAKHYSDKSAALIKKNLDSQP
jgi:hypothetical protein